MSSGDCVDRRQRRRIKANLAGEGGDDGDGHREALRCARAERSSGAYSLQNAYLFITYAILAR